MKEKSLEIPSKKISQKLISDVFLYTGGLIGKYEWWIVKGANGNFRSMTKPQNKKDIIDHGVLADMFISKTGSLIGDLKDAQWYLKNNMFVVEDLPHMVAVVCTKPIKELYPYGLHGFPEEKYIKAYYGYSPRGGQSFKIGDMIFDPKWRPSKEEMETPEMKKLVRRFDEANMDFNTSNFTEADKAVQGIPFIKRGSEIIKNLEDARNAAIAIAKYLS